MKKLYTLLLLVCAATSFAQTFYSENFGTAPTGNPPATGYTMYQNTAPIAYTGTADLRNTTVSSGYTGASGSANVFFTNTVGRFLLIEGINTSTYSTANLQLSFGQLQNSASTTPDANLVVEVSSNGTLFTPLAYTRTNTTGWELITITSGIPSTTNLRIRFTQASAVQYRLDDVKLSSVSATCLLALGTETKACNASTLGMDTYTVTLPYTGGGTATYGITTTSGTIGGNNPSTVAAGNIIISGITEGTNITINITGGTCALSREVTAADCKPVNTLPFADSFNYTVGSSLTASQKWSMVNTGDNITVAAGNLTYTGVPSTGNSVSLSGTGAESYAPFTETTAGLVYTSFLMNVTDISNVTVDGTEAYFAALMSGISTATSNVRLWVKKEGTGYKLSLASGTTSATYTSATYNVGDTKLIIIGYDFTANAYKLWVNPTVATFTAATPATLTDTPAAAPTSFGGFLLRQDSATNTPTITIDEVKIGTTLSAVLAAKSFSNDISDLKMFPNPLTGNILNITSANNADKTVVVFDVLGKQVLNAKVTNETVNVSGLNAGVYIVKITEDGKTATRKLVVR